MKKILFSLFVFLSFFSVISFDAYGLSNKNPCAVDSVPDIGRALDDCLKDSYLVDGSGNMDVAIGVKQQIITWTNALAGFLALIAVGAIVYGGILMVISGGDDEKIKKGKDVIKWAMLGFLALIFAGAIVRVIVELIFSVAG